MNTPAQLLHTDKGRAAIWHKINQIERKSTFLNICLRCRNATPHSVIILGTTSFWQCQECGYPFEGEVYERPRA